MHYLPLIHNIALLVALTMVHGLLSRRFRRHPLYPLFSGLLFGCVAIIGMMTPLKFMPGIIFDGRSIVLGIAGMFGGPLTALIAAILTGSYRIWIGGGGALMGVSVIVESALLGVIWHWLSKRQIQYRRPLGLLSLGIAIHLIMVLLMLTLPGANKQAVFEHIALPVLLLYPPATLLVGLLAQEMESRTAAEEALRRSEAAARALLDAQDDVIFLVDRQARILDANTAASRGTQHSLEQLQGQDLWDLYPKHLAQSRQESFERAASSESMLQSSDAWEGHFYDLIFVPIRNASGEVDRLAVLIRDVSVRKQAEDDRLQMERQMLHVQKLESLGILAGGIAHDFNNILTAILGHAELAQLELPEHSKGHEHLEAIVGASRRASDLSHQMLAYSGRGRFVIEALDLSALVAELLQLLRASISKRAALELDLDPRLPRFEGDSTQIRQVIMNLITNASEALGDADGTIHVQTRLLKDPNQLVGRCLVQEHPLEGSYLLLEVRDTGCGMGPETLDRIFEPFFTTKFTGRGLGMAAVLGIVRSHKGSIRVDSALGKGTTFQVLLPCLEAPVEIPAQKATLSKAHSQAGRILLVDDEDMLREVGRTMLETLGYQVLTASDGLEAIEIYQKEGSGIDAVLLDLTMPHLDGAETLRELHKLDPGVKIILSSGYSQHELNARFPGPHPDSFIQKPYTLQELGESLRKTLGSDAENTFDAPQDSW